MRSETENEAVIQVKSSEQPMVFWAMQYGEYVEVLEPENIRDRIKKNLREMAEKYKVQKGNELLWEILYLIS